MHYQAQQQESKVSKVFVSYTAFKSCLFHAYLTQNEEIAGLLFGY